MLTGNCFRPLCIVSVLWHRGIPVLFSSLSSAQTFKIGSLDRSSAMVTSNEVPCTCFICVIAPTSCALKDRTTLNDCERIWTVPSVLPKKTLSDPEAMEVMLPC